MAKPYLPADLVPAMGSLSNRGPVNHSPGTP